jgi:3-phosphoshikimate 1-carboxyvinyltransferase
VASPKVSQPYPPRSGVHAPLGLQYGRPVSPPSLLVGRPAPLDADVVPPGSKSLTNRALLLGSLAEGASRLTGALAAEDTEIMIRCLGQLGIDVRELGEGTLEVAGASGAFQPPSGPLHVGTAGTVARFLTAVLCAARLEGAVVVDGTPRMRQRPMRELLEELVGQGARVTSLGERGFLPVRIDPGGALHGGEVEFERPASSQLISAMVLAAALARRPTRIVLREGTPARPYVDMTLQVLQTFGGEAIWEGPDAIRVTPRRLQAQSYAVEADASAGSYFLALAAVHGGEVRIRGFGGTSVQGDAHFCRVLGQMGARIEQTADCTIARGPEGPSPLRGIDVDLEEMPDMGLTVAAVALHAQGPTTIRGVGILRHHESDRIAAAASELRKLGATVEERADGLVVHPPAEGPRRGVSIATYDDHRMAMAFATVGDVRIENPGCVAKTFPGYFEELRRIGVSVKER